MSASEIVARLLLRARTAVWRRKSGWGTPPPRLVRVDPWEWPASAGMLGDEAESLLKEAALCLVGNYQVLNLPLQADSIDWHRDFLTGIRAPLDFAPDLDHRDQRVAGNVKNIWELNRHHHLTVLALAYAISGDERYARAVEEQLVSWIAANPPLRGINWTSALELGIRLISWVWIERLIRGTPAHDRLFGTDGVLWPSIYWHQYFTVALRSHGSSANNHLVGEMAGLYLASAVWPHFQESARWNRFAQRILEREVIKQTFSSGLNREQAFSYHIFALEFFLLAGVEGERFGKPFSDLYKDLLKRMLEVIPPLLDVRGNLPRFGDGDEGMALQVQARGSSRVDWLLRIGASWLDADVYTFGKQQGTLASSIVWPVKVERQKNERRREAIGFQDAGVFVLSSERGSSREVFCLADAGPLGFLSIAAHGHADALSFTMSVGGVPVIVDPGTYAYHVERRWRDYFRSTRAHNTVTIDGADQSVIGGPFLWLRRANVRVSKWEAGPESAVLIAEHDGYRRLPGRVMHRRRWELRSRWLEITDWITGGERHLMEWCLHFAPGCDVTLRDGRCVVTWSGGALIMNLDAQLDWRLAHAEEKAGWYSAGFNLREEAFTLIGSANRKLPLTINHQLEIWRED